MEEMLRAKLSSDRIGLDCSTCGNVCFLGVGETQNTSDAKQCNIQYYEE